MLRFRPSAKLIAINMGIIIEVVILMHYSILWTNRQLYGTCSIKLFDEVLHLLILASSALFTQIVLQELEVKWLTRMFKRDTSLLYKHCTRVRTFDSLHSACETARRHNTLIRIGDRADIITIQDRLRNRTGLGWGELFYISTGAGTGVFVVEHK